MVDFETVKALLLLEKICVKQESCAECPLKEFCGDQIQDWPN